MSDTWFKCEPTQFLLGMSRLETPEQALVYVVVCFRIYEANGPVPNDASAFVSASKLGVRKVRNAIDQLLEAGKLYLVDGELMNPRAASEMAVRSQISAARSKAGKAGGRPSKATRTDDERSANERSTSVPRETNGPLFDRSHDVQHEETAENSGSSKANAFYARAREQENTKKPPLPPSSPRPRFELVKPDFDAPIESLEERAALVAKSTGLAQSDRPGQGVDVAALTSRIMAAANMAVPPNDLPLVSGWVRMGMEPDEIVRICARLAANSRGGVKAMRYFDAEIRTVFEAKSTQSGRFIAEMEAIRARAARK